MAPKKATKFQDPPTPSESEGSEGDMDGPEMDFSRFTNPNYAREFVASLPEPVRNRVKALTSFDKQYADLKKTHEDAMVTLTRKYELLMQPLFARRKAIVTGEAAVSAEELTQGYPEEHVGKVEKGAVPAAGKPVTNFWLRALRHHCIIDDLVTDRDDEALAFLTDVRAATLESPLVGFVIQMTFAPNEFFEETALNKTFFLAKMGEEWALEKTEATKITWKAGKNLTMKTVTKKQKSKSKKGAIRYVTEEEPCESFFHFFDDSAEEDDGFAEQWFAMAQTIKDKIVPFAVDYYTGEAPDGSSDIDEDEYGDDDDEEYEEEEDEEEEPAPAPKGGRGGAAGGRGGYSGAAPPARGAGGKQPQECKQQ